LEHQAENMEKAKAKKKIMFGPDANQKRGAGTAESAEYEVVPVGGREGSNETAARGNKEKEKLETANRRKGGPGER